jgi:integrase
LYDGLFRKMCTMARQKDDGRGRLGGRRAGVRATALSDATVKSKPPGLYADGNGLYLRVAAGGVFDNGKPRTTRSWLYRYMLSGKAHTLGLGTIELVSLADARAKAVELGKAKKSGTDPASVHHASVIGAAVPSVIAGPVEVPVEMPAGPTFAQVAELFLASRTKWRAEDEKDKWLGQFRLHANSLLNLPIGTIEPHHLLAVLTPLQTARPNLCVTLQRRLARIFRYAKAHGYYRGDNPAEIDEDVFEVTVPEVRHRAALDWRSLAAFIERVRGVNNPSARVKALALEFLILTGSRTGEIVGNTRKPGMVWGEIDWSTRTWTVPGWRTKNGKDDDRVPLSDRAMVILGELRGTGNIDPTVRVFPLSYDNWKKWLSDFRPKGEDFTFHGFRSSLRGWGKASGVPDTVLELIIGHDEAQGKDTGKSKTMAAYDRDDLLEQRRPVMQAWAGYLDGGAMPSMLDWQRMAGEAKERAAA